MIVNLRYLLISLVSHIIFFSLFFFLFYNSYFNKVKNLSIIAPGSPLYINVVNNKPCNSKKKILKVKKQEFNCPKSTKSEISEVVEKQQVLKKVKSLTSDGSGGISNDLSNTSPVVYNEDIINCSPPLYPRSSLELGEEGKVIVRVLVDTKGKIVDYILYKTSGFKSLDDSVIKSIKLWTINRIPNQKIWIEVAVDFFIVE